MSRYYGGWAPYVPVAERRRKAAREMAKLRKKGHPVAPVMIEGRAIATTFWGKAWCDNLESYRDYREPAAARAHLCAQRLGGRPADRAARGHGDGQRVVDLPRQGQHRRRWPKAQWKSICKDCAGGIDSLVELLQGRFSQGRDGAHLPAGHRAVPASQRRSGSRAVARTMRRCASTSRRCCTASARGSTSSRSCCSGCARWTRRIWWPDRSVRCR